QVRDLACGLAHTVLVTEGGEVLAWGENKYSQCGTSGTTPVARPVFLGALLGVRIRSVACGGAHSAVISETGKIYSWGMGASGQLGHGARAQVALPTPIAALSAGTRILATTCGFGHTLIVTEAGSLLACGWNSSGQCGTAGGSDALVPTEIRLPGRATVQHASCGAGTWHSAVVTHAGALYTFGSGSCGQLGHGDSTDSPSPKRVEALSGYERPPAL
ncbi:regulator of chromosome condensation 1/beta-lactamase-inhibitor protein II, partial [Baffinella frigidus]